MNVAPFAPTGRFGTYDAVGNAPLGFHIPPSLSARWASSIGSWMNFRPPVTTQQEVTPVNVFSSGGALGSTDWGGLIGTLGGQVAGIFAQKEQNKMLKRLMRGSTRGLTMAAPGMGFAPAAGVPAATGGAWAGTAGGLLGAGALGLLPELGDMLPGGLEESGTGLFGPDLFAVGATSRRQRMIDAVHPTTGERVYWRPVGRPIMFTGDAALLKRTRKMVRKMSSTAGCGVAGRTFRRRRR